MTGIVRSISGNTVTIESSMEGACFGCMNVECKKNGANITAENSLKLDLHPGQLVETGQNSGALFVQGVLALLPPAAGFIAGHVLVSVFGAAVPLRILGGFIFLIAAAFIVYFLRRRFPVRSGCSVRRIISG
jgi:positive regulator of sigma E activity